MNDALPPGHKVVISELRDDPLQANPLPAPVTAR
jgi:hypothetical protein